jgi:thioredoxin reductase
MSECDVVVIGGGAAGLSAALVLSRARRSVVIVDGGDPRNGPAAHMHGFLSRDGFPPADLLAAGRAEITAYGGQLVAARVDTIRRTERGLEVVCGHATYTTRRVLVATGLRDELPDLPGVRERWGRDLLHCPYCHGYEVRDQQLGVLGASETAVQHAQLVRQWSSDVVLFTGGEELPSGAYDALAARGISVIGDGLSRLVVEDDRLVGVELTGGRVIDRSAVFVRPVLVPRDELLRALGCTTDSEGWVVVDALGRTSEPGVWAAGNVVNPRAQVITAAGEGSTSAIAINAELVDDDVRAALQGQGGGTAPRA